MKKTIIIFCLKNIALFGVIPDQKQENKPTLPLIKTTHKMAKKETCFDPIDEGLEKLFQQTDTPDWREQFTPSLSTSFLWALLCLGQ